MQALLAPLRELAGFDQMKERIQRIAGRFL